MPRQNKHFLRPSSVLSIKLGPLRLIICQPTLSKSHLLMPGNRTRFSNVDMTFCRLGSSVSGIRTDLMVSGRQATFLIVGETV